MTDNIQKLYEIAGVERIYSEFNNGKETIVERVFSPYKQLELIKLLMKYKQTLLIELQYFEGDYCVTHCAECEDNDGVEYVITGRAKLLENAIADLFIDMWQDLTEEQKQEIKRILK